jgi:hypothetical protein
MRTDAEEYSESAKRQWEDISKPSSLWKASLLPKKEQASQNTANCADCGDVYEEPIPEDWTKCGQCWRGGTRSVRVVKELVVISVILLVYARLPDPSRTLTRQGARQYALCRSSFQWLLQQPVGQTKQKSKCLLLPDFPLRINSRDTLRHVSVKLGSTECQCYQQL